MGAGASVDVVPLDGELKELLSYYDGNLETADAVNREIVRVVPKTGSGRFVPERGEQTAVQGVVDRARLSSPATATRSRGKATRPPTATRRARAPTISSRKRGGSK